MHAIQDVNGAHSGVSPLAHIAANLGQDVLGVGVSPDRVIGDSKFFGVANELYQLFTGNSNITLTPQQMNELLMAVIEECKGQKSFKKFEITRPRTVGSGGGGGGGEGFGGGFGGYPSWWYSMWDFLRWIDSIPVGGPKEEEDHYA